MREEMQLAINTFCEDIEKVITILEEHKSPKHNGEKFSHLLYGVFIGVHEEMCSSMLLVKNKYFFSLIKIARSLYELAIQLQWIKSLEQEKQQCAIEKFLAFDGNEKKHEWYKLVDKNMTMREMSKILGLNRSIFNADMTPLASPQADFSNNNNLEIYDYLCKAAHWNPIFLKHFIGFEETQSKFQIKESSSFLAFYIVQNAIRISAYVFTNMWLETCFPEDTKSREALKNLLQPSPASDFNRRD